MARAIDMGIVPVLRLVLDMRRRNRDAARLLFRRLVDLVIGRVRRPTRLRQNLGDRCRQRRLAMVNMANRANVAVRLVAVEFLFGHRLLILLHRLAYSRSTSGAGEGNRTLVFSLEGCCSTIELHPPGNLCIQNSSILVCDVQLPSSIVCPDPMVGEVGLEPTKAKPADLQSAPFATRDTPPIRPDMSKPSLSQTPTSPGFARAQWGAVCRDGKACQREKDRVEAAG